MKPTHLLMLSALCLLNAGCTLIHNLARTSIVQPIQYCNHWDEMRDRHRFRKLAQLELERARCIARAESDNYACAPFSIDEERGFEDGFVDYLVYGGTGISPPLPPRGYWWSDCQSAHDCNAIEDWFRGFHHGAAVAEASGHRECVTVPLSDAPFRDKRPIYNGQLAASVYVEPFPVLSAPADIIPADDIPADIIPADGIPADGLIESTLTQSAPSAGKQQPASGELPAIWKSTLQPGPYQSVYEPRQPRAKSTPPSPDLVLQTAFSMQESEAPHSGKQDSTIAVGSSPIRSDNLAEVAGNAGVQVEPRGASQQPVADHERIAPTRIAPEWIAPARIAPTRIAPARIAPESISAPEDSQPPAPVNPSAVERDSRQTKNGAPSKPLPPQSGWKRFAGGLLLVAGGLLLVHHRMSSLFVWIVQLLRFGAARICRRSPRPLGAEIGDPTAVGRSLPVALIATFAACLMTGCSSLTNPVVNGIPVRKLPTELLSQPQREALQTVPLSLLRQKQPENYILAGGDVLGVFIAGVFPLTLADQPLTTPPVYFPSQIDPLGAGLPPSLGYPVTIRNDGTLALPMVEPILLDGLTVEEANERVRNAYLDRGILQPGRESVILTLMKPRQTRVLVFRQEVGGFSAGGRGDISSNNVKRGTGHVVDLRAYENDVVNALANTGGLPGQDAFNGIYIFRGGQSSEQLTEQLRLMPSGAELSQLTDFAVETDYIPTRWPPGEALPFGPEDVILHDGDVVFMEARNSDFFYTGGLLPAGERVLPRDYDLDVVEAVAQVSGTMINGAFGGNNFNGLLIQKGIGNPNPSALTVIRRTPNGGQIPISVDLNRALIDPRERILVQPDDVLILQETQQESIARYINDIFFFNVNIFQTGSASSTAVAPVN